MATIVTAAELAGDVEAFLRFKRAMGAPYRRGQWDLELRELCRAAVGRAW